MNYDIPATKEVFTRAIELAQSVNLGTGALVRAEPFHYSLPKRGVSCYCADGLLLAANGWDDETLDTIISYDDLNTIPAVRHLARVIEDNAPAPFRLGHDDPATLVIHTWNDVRAQQSADVVTMLEKARDACES